jgi:paraquat-inducible protein A
MAMCPRCASPLYRPQKGSLAHPLALHVTALVLFIIANSFPFITFKMEGREQTSTLITGVFEFAAQGLWFLAILVLAVTIVFPLGKILATLFVLLYVRSGGGESRAVGRIFKLVETLHPWAMMEVFLLGVLVAYVKLTDFATLELGPALYAFAALILVMVAGEVAVVPRAIWGRLGAGIIGASAKASRDLRHSVCHSCGLIHFDVKPGLEPHCPRCGTHLHHRKPNSLTRCWALLATAAILYVPANVYPVMTVISFGQGEPDTILSGVKALVEADMWPLAAIVFFASITVPVLKLCGLSFLMWSVQTRSRWRPRDRTLLFRIVEAVGRWSMIDVFMISILIALVKLGNIATIEPGIGATSFAAVVILTMIASHNFDPRLIWDAVENTNGKEKVGGGSHVSAR